MVRRWIEIYGTDGCAPCNQTKKYLDGKGVHYEYVDVSLAEGAVEQRYQEALKLVGGLTQIPLVTDGAMAFTGVNYTQLNKMIRDM